MDIKLSLTLEEINLTKSNYVSLLFIFFSKIDHSLICCILTTISPRSMSSNSPYYKSTPARFPLEKKAGLQGTTAKQLSYSSSSFTHSASKQDTKTQEDKTKLLISRLDEAAEQEKKKRFKSQNKNQRNMSSHY